ncbi:MAG: FAD:protein FMN transferase [Bacteroidales bacterium]|nr:FAD:protein FMN transferase [Bacteroidales bacterium]
MTQRFVLFLSSILAAAVSCAPETLEFERFTGNAQGTTYSIVFETGKRTETAALKEGVGNLLRDFDMSLSLYEDSSLLSRINRNEDISVDEYFTEAYERSLDAYKLTGGAFDITVGPLVRAWGFGPEAHKNFSPAKRDSLIKLVGMSKISLVNGKLVKSDPAIRIDFNAIAQGYSVDVVCDYLLKQGLDNFLVEIGGEVRAVGNKTGEGWKVGIDRPEDNNFSPGANLQAIIRLDNMALATSGNYRKFFIENGVKYSHTIDPTTGYPSKNNLLSATIIAADCSAADAVATACMVMGKERAIDFIRSNPAYGAYLVYSGDNGEFLTWISDDLKEYITEDIE